MTTATVDMGEVKESVLVELGHNPRRPTELLTILGSRYSDPIIKEVVLRLLQEGRIQMAENRTLRIVGEAR